MRLCSDNCDALAVMLCGPDAFCADHADHEPAEEEGCGPRRLLDGTPLESLTVHDLKTWTTPFKATWDGLKTLEIRKNDRGYRAGHALHLREWAMPAEVDEENHYTGASILALVTHVQEGFGLPDGFVAMSIKVLKKTARSS